MKQHTIFYFFIIILAAHVMPMITFAEQWHYQATVEVHEPGLTEAVLPAGLFFSNDGSTPVSITDLSLIGPDGNPRSFELYWKEENSPRSAVLKPVRISLDKTHALIWEAASPKDLKIEKIRIDFTSPQTVGQVTIEGKDAQGWHILVENAALYDALSETGIEISPAVYEKLRLSFKGYDREFRETPFQAKSVTLTGKSIAKDFVERSIELRFSDESQEGTRTVSSVLPGSGLWIKKVILSTEAQFQGTWELGREAIIGGKSQFQELSSGIVTTVGKKAAFMEIPVDRSWPGRSLVLRLRPAGTHVGKIAILRIMVVIPRMVFYADKAGAYMARTGSGNNAVIKERPGDAEREIKNSISFSAVSDNKQWVPEGLAEKYMIAGGPFIDKGFRWTAAVNVPESGYYRLVLNQEASLSPNPEKVRLVRDNIQVPYFHGLSEEKEVALDVTPDYDKTKNRTSWKVTLPAQPGNIKEMIAEAEGIFDRTVMIETPRPGRGGWQPWKTMHWRNTAKTPSVLRMRLADLPKDTIELRITVDHGDNRPIEISNLRVTYDAPSLLFLTNKPGEYTLFGGNPKVPEARYDAALVQAHLIGAEPKAAVMSRIEPFRSAELTHKILEVFSDRSWGLYAVLGLVTAVLMILIVRLFPKEKKE